MLSPLMPSIPTRQDWQHVPGIALRPLTVGEEVVAPKNSNISIKLLDAASAGKVKGKSEIQIGLDSV